jgi:predicted nucleic acid-binding protein
VKVYLDTNILVAASVREHPHHAQSFDLVRAVKEGALRGCISTHGLAEFYSVLTRAPFTPRVHPTEAGRFLDDNILPYFELVALSANDYKAVIRSCASAGLIGGVVFDALHLHCAQKAGCDRVYTLNVKDFRALAADDLSAKIGAP